MASDLRMLLEVVKLSVDALQPRNLIAVIDKTLAAISVEQEALMGLEARLLALKESIVRDRPKVRIMRELEALHNELRRAQGLDK